MRVAQGCKVNVPIQHLSQQRHGVAPLPMPADRWRVVQRAGGSNQLGAGARPDDAETIQVQRDNRTGDLEANRALRRDMSVRFNRKARATESTAPAA